MTGTETMRPGRVCARRSIYLPSLKMTEVYVVTVHTCPGCASSEPVACFTSRAQAHEFEAVHIADHCKVRVKAVPLDRDISDF